MVSDNFLSETQLHFPNETKQLNLLLLRSLQLSL